MNHQTKRSTRLQEIGRPIQKIKVLDQATNVVIHQSPLIIQQSTIPLDIKWYKDKIWIDKKILNSIDNKLTEAHENF